MEWNEGMDIQWNGRRNGNGMEWSVMEQARYPTILLVTATMLLLSVSWNSGATSGIGDGAHRCVVGQEKLNTLGSGQKCCCSGSSSNNRCWRKTPSGARRHQFFNRPRARSSGSRSFPHVGYVPGVASASRIQQDGGNTAFMSPGRTGVTVEGGAGQATYAGEGSDVTRRWISWRPMKGPRWHS